MECVYSSVNYPDVNLRLQTEEKFCVRTSNLLLIRPSSTLTIFRVSPIITLRPLMLLSGPEKATILPHFLLVPLLYSR
jgi:hypothetical protein